jgi:hypothetical protein
VRPSGRVPPPPLIVPPAYISIYIVIRSNNYPTFNNYPLSPISHSPFIPRNRPRNPSAPYNFLKIRLFLVIFRSVILYGHPFFSRKVPRNHRLTKNFKKNSCKVLTISQWANKVIIMPVSIPRNIPSLGLPR